MPKIWKGWSSSSKQKQSVHPDHPPPYKSHEGHDRSRDTNPYPNARSNEQLHLPRSWQIDRETRQRNNEININNEHYDPTPNEPPSAGNGAQQYGQEPSDRNEFGPLNQGLWCWIPHLKQASDDATVTDRVKDVLVSAENFVNNFYWDRPYIGDIPDGILDCTNRSSISTNELNEKLRHADHQIPIIKHVLVTRLLDLISFYSPETKESLLPVEFQNYKTLAQASVDSTPNDNGNPYIQPALSAYRVLSAYIRPNVQDDQRFLQQQTPLITKIIDTFEDVFGYWAKEERRSEDRRTILKRLIELTRELGIFLFSQPSVYWFHWDVKPQKMSRRVIPVWPTLLKVFDGDGKQKRLSDELIAMKCDTFLNEANDEWERPTEPAVVRSERVQNPSRAQESSRRLARNVREYRRKDIIPAPAKKDPIPEVQYTTQNDDQACRRPLGRKILHIEAKNRDNPEDKHDRQISDGRGLTAEAQKAYISKADKQRSGLKSSANATDSVQIASSASRSAPLTQPDTLQGPESYDPRPELVHTQVTHLPLRNGRRHHQASSKYQAQTPLPSGVQGKGNQADEALMDYHNTTPPQFQYPFTWVAPIPRDQGRPSRLTEPLLSPQETQAITTGGAQSGRTDGTYQLYARSSPIQISHPSQNKYIPNPIPPRRHRQYQSSSFPQTDNISLPPMYDEMNHINNTQSPDLAMNRTPWNLIPNSCPPPGQHRQHPRSQPTTRRRSRSVGSLEPEEEDSRQTLQSHFHRPYQPPQNTTSPVESTTEDCDDDGHRSRHRDGNWVRDTDTDTDTDRERTPSNHHRRTNTGRHFTCVGGGRGGGHRHHHHISRGRKVRKSSSSTSSVRRRFWKFR